MIFKENNKAIYLQIADVICDRIMAGSFAEGERIPSVREYAASVEVNPNTVMRSYEYLSHEGVVFNKRGIGYFIAEGACRRIREMRHETFMNGELEEVFRQLDLLGVTPEELQRHYDEYLKNKEK